mmetsp:Transcript_61821/g.139933  ORF Transcript_61821/g.139933 Transcript_61821/m.139933 type:complete len:208 (+) Transcript_61821:166-789(+)
MISSLTDWMEEEAPSILSTSCGWTDVTPVSDATLIFPPATERKGRMVSSTVSTSSTVRSGTSGSDCTTSEISGIASLRRRSRPIFMVMVEEGHEPHAPWSSSRTTGPSISVTATLPPSEIRYGLISSRIISTLSRVSSRGSFDFLGGRGVVSSSSSSSSSFSSRAANGETISSVENNASPLDRTWATWAAESLAPRNTEDQAAAQGT